MPWQIRHRVPPGGLSPVPGRHRFPRSSTQALARSLLARRPRAQEPLLVAQECAGSCSERSQSFKFVIATAHLSMSNVREIFIAGRVPLPNQLLSGAVRRRQFPPSETLSLRETWVSAFVYFSIGSNFTILNNSVPDLVSATPWIFSVSPTLSLDVGLKIQCVP